MGKSEIEMHEANDLSHNVAEISEVDQQLCGNIVISIEKMLEQIPQVNAKCNIYRVPKELHEMNHKAYVPQLISIGPFHHDTQKDLIANEQYKVQGFINFLRRINNKNIESLEEGLVKTTSLKVLVEKAHCWVKEARNCYAELINMEEEEFVIMMLVDACFIVEFFILYFDQYHHQDGKFFQIQDNVDLSFYQGIIFHILYDLIKLENQVPFFLLQSLFDLIPKDDVPMISFIDDEDGSVSFIDDDDGDTPVSSIDDDEDGHVSSIDDDEDGHVSFIDLTRIALAFGIIQEHDVQLYEEPKHLIDFLSFYFVPLPPDVMQNKQLENKNNLSNFKTFYIPACWKMQQEQNSEQRQWTPPSITEICEAGVIIKKAENSQFITNISFKNGVLEIPPLQICDDFELMLRNLIAFEHFPAGNMNKNAIQYVFFLDELISTEKDVRLLVNAGVIINNIGGSDKEVSDLFNNLCKFVILPTSSYHFSPISKALHEHCNGRWNKAKASLKHNYFNTPWAVISFFAATFLILLTVLQTIISAISAFPS